jgi:hypothetical protein
MIKGKLCECGCGKPAAIASQTETKRGYAKGCPCRFAHGHRAKSPTIRNMVAPNPSGFCFCGCGQRTTISTYNNLHSGYVKGQYKKYVWGHAIRGRKIALRHGMYGTSEHTSFRSAKARCKDRKHRNWRYYGGCGIKFLFKSFEEFYAELGPKPTPQHTVDRYPNNDGHYEKGNVRWATKAEQTHNRRLKSRLSTLRFLKVPHAIQRH